jgi:hypothetical protein
VTGSTEELSARRYAHVPEVKPILAFPDAVSRIICATTPLRFRTDWVGQRASQTIGLPNATAPHLDSTKSVGSTVGQPRPVYPEQR